MIDVTATTIGRSASAKEVTALARSFALTDDELSYTADGCRGATAAALPVGRFCGGSFMTTTTPLDG